MEVAISGAFVSDLVLHECWRENRHSSRKKVSFLGQNFQHQSALISEFATRLEDLQIWACSARRVLSEYNSLTPGSFLELDSRRTKFQGVYYMNIFMIIFGNNAEMTLIITSFYVIDSCEHNINDKYVIKSLMRDS